MLKDGFKLARAATGLSQAEFGERCGWDQGRQSHYETGRREPGEAEIKRAAKESGLSISDIYGETQPTERGLPKGKYEFIPYYDVQFAAGNGVEDDHYSEVKDLAFRKSWLAEHGFNQNCLVIVEVSGHSMQPRLHNGDKVLVDTACTEIKDGKIYALSYGNQLKIKRLEMRYDEAMLIHSDNPSPEYTTEVVPPADLEHIKIVGRVVHLVAGGGF